MKGKTKTTISKRQRQILEYLYSKNDYTTAQDIASHLSVSSKTIYRELDVLKNQKNDLGICFDSKIGSGIKLISDRNINDISKDIGDYQTRYIVLKNYLLRIAPKNVYIEELSDKFFVSKTSIIADLKKIEKEISVYNLTLVKNKKGICIDGNEFDIRRALAYSLIDYEKNDNAYLGDFTTRFDESTYKTLCNHFSEDLVDFIEYLLRQIEKDLGYEIVEPYYINIVTHLLIMVIRLMQGRSMNDENATLEMTDVHKLRIAVHIAKRIEDRYRVHIPNTDVRYIYEHLDSIGYSSEIIEKKANTLLIDEKTKLFAFKILDYMKEEMEFTQQPEETTLRYLLLHIHSMVGRLKYRIDIRCNILPDIISKYGKLFEVTKKNVNKAMEIYFPDLLITEDEIGFLTIYFQSLIETQNKRGLRVIVVCSSSVGTSHMLMVQIKKRYPEWEIVDQLPASRLESKIYEYENIDLILSTVKIPSYSLSIPIAFVSVMFSDNDVKIVNKVLEKRL